MSYSNPISNEAAREPIGLDAALVALQASFNQIPWANGYVFLRAYEIKFPNAMGKMESTPQVYMGKGEYYDVSYNDNLPCTIFFKTNGPEDVDFTKPKSKTTISYVRPMSLIFWGNLKRISADYSADYIYVEPIKQELMEILGKASSVVSIDRFYDDPLEDVFKDYTLPSDKRQMAKYPFVALRIDFNIQYRTGLTQC